LGKTVFSGFLESGGVPGGLSGVFGDGSPGVFFLRAFWIFGFLGLSNDSRYLQAEPLKKEYAITIAETIKNRKVV